MSASGNRGRGFGAQPVAPLYERLPHGPHQIARAEVIRHQRQRIQGALVESIATRGYMHSSVKHIVALAGVSRRSFYEQYENKQNCFLVTFDEIVERVRERILTTCQTIEGDLAEHLLGALGALASEVLEHPKDARLVFVEIDLLGKEGADRLIRTAAGFERLLAERINPSDGVPPTLLKAATGAIRNTVSMLIEEQRGHELPSLGERMLSWLMLLDHPASQAVHDLMRACASERVRRAKEATSHAQSGDSPRDQLLASALQVAHDVGLKELSAIQIAEVAGLSLDVFFEHFQEHEQCVLEALDAAAERSLNAITEPEQSTPWPQQVCRAVSSLLFDLAGDQLHAWAVLCASREVGAPGIERERRLARNIAERICAPIPQASVDEVVIAQTTGAIWHTVWSLQTVGRMHLLAALDGYVSYLVLAPIIGPQDALETIRQHVSDSGE